MKTLVLALIMMIGLNAHATDSLKVLNWNVYMLPWPIKKSMQGDRSKLIAQAMLKTNYDVLFFEEAFSKGFRKEMRKTLSAKYPYSYYLGSDGRLPHVFGSGLLVMSPRPFKVLDHVYYDKCAGADCFAAKGALLIEATLANRRRVQFASTHLQASDKQGAKRIRQVSQIDVMLAKHRQRGIAQILVGDMNLSPDEADFAKAKEIIGMRHATLTGEIPTTSGRKNECYKIPGDRVRWIDHAFASKDDVGAIASRVRDYTYVSKGRTCPYSDHHAVEIRAELR